MKIILCENVPNLGQMGATVNVAPGYARNYLIPRKLAVQSDSATAKQIEHEMRIIKRREERRRAEVAAFAKQLEGLTLEVMARAGEEDKIFGSVTTAVISEKLAEQGHTIEKKYIVLDEPIRSLGIHSVPVQLGMGVKANVKVWVKKEEDAKEETAE